MIVTSSTSQNWTKKTLSLALQANVIFLTEKVATYDTCDVNQNEGLVRVKRGY
jgi:hypothetical protein